MITSLGIKTNVSSKKKKKGRYAITNVSMKYLSNIIKKVEMLPYKGYVRKTPKHELTLVLIPREVIKPFPDFPK